MPPPPKRRIDDYYKSTKRRRTQRRYPSRWERTRRWLSAAAGGTLGFIAGNTRGAYHGTKLGYRAAIATERQQEQLAPVYSNTTTRSMLINNAGEEHAGFSRVTLGRQKRNLPKWFDDMTGPRRVSSTIVSGQLGLDSTRNLWFEVPLTHTGVAGPGGVSVNYAHGLADLTTYLAATDVDSVTTGGSRTKRFYVEGHKLKMTIKNHTSVTMEVELYHITNRRDLQVPSEGTILLTPLRAFTDGYE